MSEPIISCIMPTRDRPEWAALAFQWFARQTYARRELIVVDQGTLPLPSLPINSKVCRVGRDLTVGEMRNIGISQSSGEYVTLWDDDDWSDEHRLEWHCKALYHRFDISLGCTPSVYFCDSDSVWAPKEKYVDKQSPACYAFRRKFFLEGLAFRPIHYDRVEGIAGKVGVPVGGKGDDTIFIEDLLCATDKICRVLPFHFLVVNHDDNLSGNRDLSVRERSKKRLADLIGEKDAFRIRMAYGKQLCK